MGFEDEVDTAAKGMGGGDYFKFKEGDNKLRIMSEPVVKVTRFGYGICYEGAPYCQKETLDRELAEAQEKARKAGNDPDEVQIRMPSTKFAVWAIDRTNGSFVIVDLPYAISKTLKEHKVSEESGFEGWPMPYDINIKAKGAGKKSVKYEFLASRKNTAVTAEEQAEFEKLTPIKQILDKQKAKQKAKFEGGEVKAPIEYPQEDINPDDIPF